MFATDAKMQKIEPDPNLFDRWKIRRQCVNVIGTTRGRIYFLFCNENFGREFQTPCTKTLLSLQSHDFPEIILICWFAAQEAFLNIINVENNCLIFLYIYKCHIWSVLYTPFFEPFSTGIRSLCMSSNNLLCFLSSGVDVLNVTTNHYTLMHGLIVWIRILFKKTLQHSLDQKCF